MNHYRFEDMPVGLEEQFEADITEEKLEQFYLLSGDANPLHRDAEFARGKGYPDRVAYGMLTASLFSTLAGMYLPGEQSLIHTVETEFCAPVYAGDHLTVTGWVHQRNETFRTVTLKVAIRNQRGEKVCRGKMRVGFQREEEREKEVCS